MQWIVSPLLEWYYIHRRMLPWREEQTAYHVWISEIMLQQTRIEAVKKYYERFTNALPTIEALANVEEDKLLKLWEGLGYYNRARNLQKAAKKIMEEHQGEMPKDYATLLTLPGIGEYTAGAIASIIYNEKVPAVDGNVLRVIARVRADDRNVLLPATKKEVTQDLTNMMPEEAGMFNEALMELGETVCISNTQPLCDICPLAFRCEARRLGKEQELPVREKKKGRKIEHKHVYILRHGKEIAILKREEGMLQGLYELPNSDKPVEEQLQEWEVEAESIEKKGTYKHIFTHKEWYMQVYAVQVKQKNTLFTWVEENQIRKEYPMPTAFLKAFKV